MANPARSAYFARRNAAAKRAQTDGVATRAANDNAVRHSKPAMTVALRDACVDAAGFSDHAGY